jgi:NADH-quinone oxidoreductase subunit N
VIGAFYYLKVVKVLYFDEAADKVKGSSDIAHGAAGSRHAVHLAAGLSAHQVAGPSGGTAVAALFHG